MNTICVCGSAQYRNWNTVSGVALVECLSCSVIRVSTVDKESYENLYRSGKYHAEGSDDLTHQSAGREPHKTRFNDDYTVAHARVDKLTKYKRGGTLIDVGCANGAFMLAARQPYVDERGIEARHRFTVYGVDLSLDAVHPEMKEYVRCGALNRAGFQRRCADVITFNDSFEHFVDPVAALRSARGILKRDGILVIEIPDMGCSDAIQQGPSFKHVKPHEHLWYFTATQLRDLLQSNGFTVLGMDVPVPGKVTAYASPACVFEDIEIHGPPGVGDTLWTLHKVAPIWRKEYPCRIKYVVCSSGEQKIVTRAKDFLLLCPYINSIDFRNLEGQPLPPDAGCEDPSLPVYELFPNDYLDPKVPPYKGGMIEKWHPELESDWDTAFTIPEAALEQARLRTKQYGKFVAIYMSSHVWNWTVADPVWTAAHWAELLIKLSDMGLKPLILGAEADADFAGTVAENIITTGKDPAKIWVNTIGKTSLPLAMAYMHLASVTIGIANGLPMLPLYNGKKSIILWPVRGMSRTKAEFCEEFSFGFLPPHIRNSGQYTRLTIGHFTVQDLFNAIKLGAYENQT